MRLLYETTDANNASSITKQREKGTHKLSVNWNICDTVSVQSSTCSGQWRSSTSWFVVIWTSKNLGTESGVFWDAIFDLVHRVNCCLPFTGRGRGADRRIDTRWGWWRCWGWRWTQS